MSGNDGNKRDFLDAARKQFAQVAAEFEKTLEGLKDPQRRKEMTSSYLHILQNGLSKAQHTVATYQQKVERGSTHSDAAATTPSSSESSATPPPTPSTPDDEAGAPQAPPV